MPELILGIQGAICVPQDPVNSAIYICLTNGTDQACGSVTKSLLGVRKGVIVASPGRWEGVLFAVCLYMGSRNSMLLGGS